MPTQISDCDTDNHLSITKLNYFHNHRFINQKNYMSIIMIDELNITQHVKTLGMTTSEFPHSTPKSMTLSQKKNNYDIATFHVIYNQNKLQHDILPLTGLPDNCRQYYEQRATYNQTCPHKNKQTKSR